MIRIAAFELALEKAVEVGVTRIVPFTAARSNAVAGNRHDRWSRIVIEAAKQSKRYHRPGNRWSAKFDQVLAIPASIKDYVCRTRRGPLKSALAGSPCFVLDRARRRMDGCGNVRGPRVRISCGVARSGHLKAETAAIVGGALIRYELEQRSQEPKPGARIADSFWLLLLASGFLVLFSCSAFAQQRPLITEDPRLISDGSSGNGARIHLSRTAQVSPFRPRGQRVSAFVPGLNFGLGPRAEFQIRWIGQNFLWVRDNRTAERLG